MASGKMGSKRLAANTDELLYTVPANTLATINVMAVNCSTTSAAVRIAITTAASPGDADWIDYDTQLPPGGGIERSALVLSAGEKVFVRANGLGVTARVHGFEEGAA